MTASHPHTARIPLVTATVALLLALVSSLSLAAAQDFGNSEPGRTIYNRAGLLTPAEVTMLAARAAAVEQAGAPVVVYLQAKDATFDQTLRDGRDLMEAWDVQTAPAARDGVVILLNLDPDNPRRGQLALIAGAAHFDGGNLPQRELDRITAAMLERLAADDTAGGLALGLDMLADSLINGPVPPPPPSAIEEFADAVAGGPVSVVNVIAAILGALGVWFTARVWRSRPLSNAPATPTINPPEDLSPALAGALVLGSLNDSQLEGTVLHLALRGALAIEPEGNKKARIRLLDGSVVRGEFEQHLWAALEAEAASGADGERIISSKRLSKVRSHWKPARDALRADLEARGWFARHPGQRRRPGLIVGSSLLVIAVAAFIISVIGATVWGLVGSGILAIVGFAVLIAAFSIHDTTVEGETRAQPWRGYRQGLKDARDNTDIDLDTAVPYVLAMNATATLDKRLKAASASGYRPLWLGSQSTADWGTAGFYPYFIVFHASMTPSSSGSTSGGGASSGSGGSGGSF